VIVADSLSKSFSVHRKDPGLWGSVRSLFRRQSVLKHAVRGVSFSIAEGEIVGLVGANGAGKTTLVKMLAGIIHPSGGDAQVLGFRPWEHDDRLRRQIALIMGQKAQLWWDLPAADCFLLLREIYQIPRDRYQATLDELAALLRVEDQLAIPIRRLSLGERMKMELIAALLHRPRVVFLDEPTIGLDLDAQQAVREFLLAYRREHQPAMIVTSHYMEDIERLCERLLVLREGELVYDGPLRQVVELYATHKVITATLRPGEVSADSPVPPEVADLGAVREHSPLRVRVEVPRDRVTAAASLLLARYPVADLTIEEEDVGAIIGRILAGRVDR
jgi:ABC-2 type transport system ATP-binding protein